LIKVGFKGGFGFHPIGVWCDNTAELLAISLRPGNAGSNHAGDHIDVLGRAVAQIPARHRRRLLVRADGAGQRRRSISPVTSATSAPSRISPSEVIAGVHTRSGMVVMALVNAVFLIGKPTEYSTRRPRTWPCSVSQSNSSWVAPAGMRVIVRRERPHPGAQLSLLEEADGWRYQAFATNTGSGQLAFLEARRRAHARVEDRIKAAKDTGLGRFPSREYAINQAWLQLKAYSNSYVINVTNLLAPHYRSRDKKKPHKYMYRLRSLNLPLSKPVVPSIVLGLHGHAGKSLTKNN
jgi:Transposase DDE domain group 1